MLVKNTAQCFTGAQPRASKGCGPALQSCAVLGCVPFSLAAAITGIAFTLCCWDFSDAEGICCHKALLRKIGDVSLNSNCARGDSPKAMTFRKLSQVDIFTVLHEHIAQHDAHLTTLLGHRMHAAGCNLGPSQLTTRHSWETSPSKPRKPESRRLCSHLTTSTHSTLPPQTASDLRVWLVSLQHQFTTQCLSC